MIISSSLTSHSEGSRLLCALDFCINVLHYGLLYCPCLLMLFNSCST
uniref:Uncharacterized protein n=1 Tax=Anguilla anguilla TaxID=7936 RepID=A0A0E9QXI6_ANGAN